METKKLYTAPKATVVNIELTLLNDVSTGGQQWSAKEASDYINIEEDNIFE